MNKYSGNPETFLFSYSPHSEGKALGPLRVKTGASHGKILFRGLLFAFILWLGTLSQVAKKHCEKSAPSPPHSDHKYKNKGTNYYWIIAIS